MSAGGGPKGAGTNQAWGNQEGGDIRSGPWRLNSCLAGWERASCLCVPGMPPPVHSGGWFLLRNGARNSLGLGHRGRPACVPAAAPAEQPSPQRIPVVIYSFALKGPLPAPYVLLFILQDLAQWRRLVGPFSDCPTSHRWRWHCPRGFPVGPGSMGPLWACEDGKGTCAGGTACEGADLGNCPVLREPPITASRSLLSAALILLFFHCRFKFCIFGFLVTSRCPPPLCFSVTALFLLLLCHPIFAFLFREAHVFLKSVEVVNWLLCQTYSCFWPLVGY